MVANIETSSDGRAAFVTREVPAWHSLGTVLRQDEALSTKEVLDIAHLSNWNVRLVEHVVSVAGEEISIPKSFLTIRNNPFGDGIDVLGQVGSKYVVTQNEDAFAFAQNVADSGAPWETAGSIDDGRTVFGTFALEREVILDPNGAEDVIKNYLLVDTGHDGKRQVRVTVTPTRVVCQNTLQLALERAKVSWSIKHTRTVDGLVHAARDSLALADEYLDAFAEEAQRLLEAPLSKSDFERVSDTFYPRPEKDVNEKTGNPSRAFTVWSDRKDLLNSLFTGGTNTKVTGTVWAGINAHTEYLDWFVQGRGENADQNRAAAATGLTSVTLNRKNEIHDRFAALVS